MSQTKEWKELMRNLFNECFAQTESTTTDFQSNDILYCPRAFDGFLCWPRTPAGQLVSQKCPPFVTGFDSHRLAYRECLNNGTWFKHPDSGVEWSNYTTCIDFEDLLFHRSVNILFISGYMISLITLVLSMAIFLGFRVISCTRIRIHIQLFTSLALTCVSWICWYKLVVENPSFITDHQQICIAMHLVIHYLMLTNYFWMFCEGLHLLLVLVVVFIRETLILRCFYFIGWLLPFPIIIIYYITRLQRPSSSCWMDDDASMWILTAPVTLSLITSLCFLIYVVRVLVTKLNTNSCHLPPMAFRKAVRATFILVPLFGLQHILLPLRPDPGTFIEGYYQIFSAVIISSQGLCVSCLFCFFNQEVIVCVRSLLHRCFPRLISATVWESVNGAPPTQTRDVVV